MVRSCSQEQNEQTNSDKNNSVEQLFPRFCKSSRLGWMCTYAVSVTKPLHKAILCGEGNNLSPPMGQTGKTGAQVSSTKAVPNSSRTFSIIIATLGLTSPYLALKVMYTSGRWNAAPRPRWPCRYRVWSGRGHWIQTPTTEVPLYVSSRKGSGSVHLATKAYTPPL